MATGTQELWGHQWKMRQRAPGVKERWVQKDGEMELEGFWLP